MAVIVAMVIMGDRRMGVVAMPVAVTLDGISARVARMRPENRDQPREDGAEQRQEDDCLIHASCPNPSSD